VAGHPLVDRISRAAQSRPAIKLGDAAHSRGRAQGEQDGLRPAGKPAPFRRRPRRRLAFLRGKTQRLANSRRLEREKAHVPAPIQPTEQPGAGGTEPAVAVEDKRKGSRSHSLDCRPWHFLLALGFQACLKPVMDLQGLPLLLLRQSFVPILLPIMNDGPEGPGRFQPSASDLHQQPAVGRVCHSAHVLPSFQGIQEPGDPRAALDQLLADLVVTHIRQGRPR